MSPGYALFFGFIGGYLGMLVISYWARKLGKVLSGKGTLLTGLFSFLAAFLFLLLAPESLLIPVALIFLGILMLTLIIFWISGN